MVNGTTFLSSSPLCLLILLECADTPNRKKHAPVIRVRCKLTTPLGQPMDHQDALQLGQPLRS